MQTRHLLFCVAALGFGTAASAQTPWEKYLDLPTAENARKVQAATYSVPSDNHDRLYEDLELLEVQVVAGDRQAVRLALRLYSEADGHYAETLDILLGRLVRVNPRLLLEELRLHRKRAGNRHGFGMLRNYGFPYVDRGWTADMYETERRIAALKTVTDVDLRPLRDSCLAMLQYDLDEARKGQTGRY